MRHGISGNKLNRNSSHRKATIRDVAKAALIQQRICTTKAKAKEARKLVDKLITLGKNGSLADKRRAFAILCDHKLVSNLFSKTSPRFKNRIGGYTRIIPVGIRRGDNAQLAYLELTEKEEVIVSKPKSAASAKSSIGLPSLKTSPKASEKVIDAEVKTDKAPSKPAIDTVKETTQKKDDVKQSKKATAIQEKGKKGKNFFSGIRKMFNKKSSGK